MTGAFNPLERLNLAKSIESELLRQPCGPLLAEPFEGAGIYAIYYVGDFPEYAPIVTGDCDIPIYVGKATPKGGRTGGFITAEAGPALRGRLREHAVSVEAATNLSLDDFRCRYLVVEDIWIPLGEALLISHFEPIWNIVVEGFGKHASGAARRAGMRSAWDTIHPGRSWAEHEQPREETADDILRRVADFFLAKKPPEEKLEEIERTGGRVIEEEIERAETGD